LDGASLGNATGRNRLRDQNALGQHMNRNFPQRDFAGGGTNEDYSAAFGKIRSRLADHRGLLLVDFTRELRPNYGRVYLRLDSLRSPSFCVELRFCSLGAFRFYC
jgi:hypothetical protein